MQSNGNVTLKVINSAQLYRLEARPLQFAENADRLVRVSGHLGSVVGQQDPRTPSFVVDSVNALASSCSAKITPAMLKEGAADSAGASAGPAVRVGMTDMAFTPARIVINAGQPIIWKNTSEVVHNVVDDADKAVTATDVALPAGVQPFGSDYLQPGQTFSRVFTKPGTYRYVCTLHEGNGMKGVVVVR